MATLHADKWFVNYESLDNDQKKLVNGSVFENGEKIGFIGGPAGSGKTIILVNALSKANNKSVAFISYTRSLLNLADQGLPNGIKAMTYHEALKDAGFYDLIVVDEVQDVPVTKLNKIISKANKVILAGDVFQKIFSDGVDMNSLTSISNRNIHKLTKTYRLTPTAFAAASKINPGALEGVSPSGKSVVPIELYYTDNYSEGDSLCYDMAIKQAAQRRTTAIILPNREKIIDFANDMLIRKKKSKWDLRKNKYGDPDFSSLNSHLRANNIKLQIVQNNYGDLNNAFSNSEVVIQTYHSSKGLDFKYVFLPNLSVEEATSSSEIHKPLFYVAITRASGALIITQQKNNVSSYVKKIEELCTKLPVNRINDDSDDF